MHRFTYQQRVNKGLPAPCTQEIFEQMLDSEEVANVCRRIAELDKSQPDFEEKKGALKKQLPIIIPHASAFRKDDENDHSRAERADRPEQGEGKNHNDNHNGGLHNGDGRCSQMPGTETASGLKPALFALSPCEQSSVGTPKEAGRTDLRSDPLCDSSFSNEPQLCTPSFGGPRKSSLAKPSGLVMIDVDHLANPRDVFIMQVEPIVNDQQIWFAAVTPSGHGLRLIAERRLGEAIEDAQMRLAAVCGFEEIDAVTKDMARASYMMPRSYVLHYRPDCLFCHYSDRTLEFWETPLLPLANKEFYDVNQTSIGPLNKAQGLHLQRGEEVVVEPTSPASSKGLHNGPQRGLDYTKGTDPACYPDGRTDLRSDPLCDSSSSNELQLCAPSYRGLPYSAIVDKLMLLLGTDLTAVQGERNTVYFSLANHMRYICDFRSELLLQVLPAFGLSEEERRQAIRSALGRPRRGEVPLIVQSAITMVEQESSVEKSEGAEVTLTEPPLPRLPRLLQLVCKRLPDAYWPPMIIASLPILGTLATRVRFLYLDKQVHSFSFFSCISAPCASGKSFIRKPVDLLLTPINEQDEIERQKEQQYKERLRASKNAKNQPEDPHACPRNNGIAISVAKLLQLMTYSGGKHLIGISEEMDTLLKSEKAGVWSQKSDIYRLAFDNSEYGQAYMSDQSWSAKVPVYYNLLLTGTPGSMARFFKGDNVENGLATRTCFGFIPDTSYAEMPVFEPYSEKERQEIIQWARMLDKQEGMIQSPVVGKAIADWLEQKRQQAIDADSHAADIIRRRAAVIGFRAGMLCYLLEGQSQKRSIGDFATWVAEYTFGSQMRMFGDKLERELTASLEEATERGEATSLLGLLPREFDTKMLIALRAKKGQSIKPKTVTSLLTRWRQAGRIDKTGEGRYKKL